MKPRIYPFPRNPEKGQSLVEFAISLTFILILLAGLVDLGHAFFTFVQLRDAAQEGALYGSIDPGNTAAIRARVRSASDTPVDLGDTGIIPNGAIVINSGSGCEGGQVSVSITYNYPISMPFIGAIIGSNQIPITATVTDVILQPSC